LWSAGIISETSDINDSSEPLTMFEMRKYPWIWNAEE
jgi:hypothetical protein